MVIKYLIEKKICNFLEKISVSSIKIWLLSLPTVKFCQLWWGVCGAVCVCGVVGICGVVVVCLVVGCLWDVVWVVGWRFYWSALLVQGDRGIIILHNGVFRVPDLKIFNFPCFNILVFVHFMILWCMTSWLCFNYKIHNSFKFEASPPFFSPVFWYKLPTLAAPRWTVLYFNGG